VIRKKKKRRWGDLPSPLPPPRFSLGELRLEDVNFYYGSCNSLFWKLLERLYGVELRSDTIPVRL